jgi:hypothetical protein
MSRLDSRRDLTKRERKDRRNEERMRNAPFALGKLLEDGTGASDEDEQLAVCGATLADGLEAAALEGGEEGGVLLGGLAGVLAGESFGLDLGVAGGGAEDEDEVDGGCHWGLVLYVFVRRPLVVRCRWCVCVLETGDYFFEEGPCSMGRGSSVLAPLSGR